MNQIPRYNWLPERQDGALLASLDFSLSPTRSFGVLSHIINPLLIKLVQSRWFDIGPRSVFCVFMDLDFVLVQYPSILTSRFVNNPYI